jgi:hypothetical protein
VVWQSDYTGRMTCFNWSANGDEYAGRPPGATPRRLAASLKSNSVIAWGDALPHLEAFNRALVR